MKLQSHMAVNNTHLCIKFSRTSYQRHHTSLVSQQSTTKVIQIQKFTSSHPKSIKIMKFNILRTFKNQMFFWSQKSGSWSKPAAGPLAPALGGRIPVPRKLRDNGGPLGNRSFWTKKWWKKIAKIHPNMSEHAGKTWAKSFFDLVNVLWFWNDCSTEMLG